MEKITKHIKLLGLRVQDKVSGTEGVVTSVSFDLYGCIQALVLPNESEPGKYPESMWFDVARLVTLDYVPVMEVPVFLKGPAEKP